MTEESGINFLLTAMPPWSSATREAPLTRKRTWDQSFPYCTPKPLALALSLAPSGVALVLALSALFLFHVLSFPAASLAPDASDAVAHARIRAHVPSASLAPSRDLVYAPARSPSLSPRRQMVAPVTLQHKQYRQHSFILIALGYSSLFAKFHFFFGFSLLIRNQWSQKFVHANVRVHRTQEKVNIWVGKVW